MNTWKRIIIVLILIGLFLLLLTACTCDRGVSIPEGVVVPLAAEPNKFKVELFADLSDIYPPKEGRPEYKFLALTISNGEGGFKPGLYATAGPFPLPRGTEVYRIDRSGKVNVVVAGFESNESILFAHGQYGDGMLVTEPRRGRIRHVLANPDGTGTLVPEPFAVVGDSSFGPIVMTYGPDFMAKDPNKRQDEVIYATDYAGGQVLRLDPQGGDTVLADISNPSGGGVKAVIVDNSGRFGGGLLVGTFSIAGLKRTNADTITSVTFQDSPKGPVVSTSIVVAEFQGLELLTFGPGGIFSQDLFVAEMGTAAYADGRVLTLSADGTLTTFLNNIDAASIVFDTEGILGGGMFVSDLTNRAGVSKIWRVTPITEEGQ